MSSNIIGERYELLAVLGRGGMAIVHRAKDVRLLREVALKVINATGAGEELLFYFHREARAIASLYHHNIIQIFDYSGREAVPTYIVTELIVGQSLAELIDDREPLPETVVAAIVYGVASGLAHAHERGVIHRDLKPHNVMVEKTGRVVLMDFGVAKAHKDPALLGATVVGRKTDLFGTPEYMAPEQVLEKPMGPPTDMFSFGSLVFGACYGASPFRGALVDMMRQIADASYVPLVRVRPGFTFLGGVIDDCLCAKPEDRVAAKEVADRCKTWLHENGIPDDKAHIQAFLNEPRDE